MTAGPFQTIHIVRDEVNDVARSDSTQGAAAENKYLKQKGKILKLSSTSAVVTEVCKQGQ